MTKLAHVTNVNSRVERIILALISHLKWILWFGKARSVLAINSKLSHHTRLNDSIIGFQCHISQIELGIIYK